MRNGNAQRRRWVYHLIGEAEEVLYVGSTCYPEGRIYDHRGKVWWTQVRKARWFCVGVISGYEAREIEQAHLDKFRPRWNLKPAVFGGAFPHKAQIRERRDEYRSLLGRSA